MKRITMLLVLGIFILSVIPMGLADEDTADDKLAKETAKNKLDAMKKKDALKDKASDAKAEAVKEKGKLADKSAKVKRKFADKDRKAAGKAMIRKAKDARKDAKNLRDRLNKVREYHKESKDKFLEHRGSLKKLRKDHKSCKESCDDKRKAYHKGWTNHLRKMIKVMDSSLGRLHETVSEKDVDGALAEVEALQTKLQVKEEAIAALEDPTKEEVKAEIVELRKLWKEVKDLKKSIVTRLINNKLENLVAKQDEILSRLQEQAGDDAALLKIVDKFKTHVDEIKVKYDLVQEAWKDDREIWQAEDNSRHRE